MYTMTIYAIFPKDKDGNVAGVYVGSTHGTLKERINMHLIDKHPSQKELHELMKTNGYIYQSLESRVGWGNRDLEYDWVDYYLKKSNLRVFNKYLGIHRDYRNCCYGRIGGQRIYGTEDKNKPHLGRWKRAKNN